MATKIDQKSKPIEIQQKPEIEKAPETLPMVDLDSMLKDTHPIELSKPLDRAQSVPTTDEVLGHITNSLNQQPTSMKAPLLASNNHQSIVKSKSVVFSDNLLLEKASLAAPESPLKLQKQSTQTPKRLRLSCKKSFNNTNEDYENDASWAQSSGKKSRGKTSLIRNQIREQIDNGNVLFDSNSKKTGSKMRLFLQDNEDNPGANAPRKSGKRPENSARYLL